MSTEKLSFDGKGQNPIELNNENDLSIIAKKDSNTVFYQLVDSGENNNIKIHLEEGSTITLFTYNNGRENFLSNLDVTLDENSEFVLYNLINKDNKTEINQVININGINANAKINNYLISTERQKIKHKAYIYHNIKQTNSSIQNYCIAKDESEIYCDNNTTIISGAKGSAAYQKTKGMLVGNKSNIEVNPNLYIDEYDVMAGHGATIGSMSKEELFYLMSRGLSKERAEHLAVVSLVNPLLNQITLEHFKERIVRDLEEKLK